ncbi:hypothetical protein [Streptomyces sp. NPDC053755]|uniref:hypothetical protein n=1 Tax=Streptomyces sp. NPDC053755 TaxID=3155815 RepID=UPI00342AA545
MTTAESWATAVRRRLGPGRLLPLGEATDGAWLTERAARGVLLSAAAAVRGAAPGSLRVGLVAPSGEEPLPVPPGGLPPGPLRITAEFAATAGIPLPGLAEAVRQALFSAAGTVLGLAVTEVDLRVTGLVETEDGGRDEPSAAPPPGRTSPAAEDPAALEALAVDGVAALTDVLGAPVHRSEGALRVELAVTAGHRALDVARAVRTRLTASAPRGTAVTVLVSEIR